LLVHAWLLAGSWEFAASAPTLAAGGFQTRSVQAPPNAVQAPTFAAPKPVSPPARSAPAPKPAAKPAALARKPEFAPAPAPTPAEPASQTANVAFNQPNAGENRASDATNTVAGTDALATPTSAQTAAPAGPEPNPPRAAPAYVLGPVAVPAPQNLAYKVSALRGGQNYFADGELTWQHDGQRYEARLQASLLWFSREFSSTGQLGAWGLEPARYADKTNRRERAAHFQRESNKISFSNNRPSATLDPGAQDRMSAILQLASLLAGAPDKYPVGGTISLQMASAGDASPVSFSVQGHETMAFAQGNASVLKLARNPRAGREFEEQVELWLMPERAYMPARIKLTQANGDFLDLVLR
jgi:hypothetical protein